MYQFEKALSALNIYKIIKKEASNMSLTCVFKKQMELKESVALAEGLNSFLSNLQLTKISKNISKNAITLKILPFTNIACLEKQTM